MSKSGTQKPAAALGIRIGAIFLLAFSILAGVAYYVLARDFKDLLTDYTTNLMQTMVDLGVTAIESELRSGQDEALLAASAFQAPADNQAAVFPTLCGRDDVLRMVYVTAEGTLSSDGRSLDVRPRADIEQAFSGQYAIYGPYFNEEGQYVLCYSAPVRQNGQITGVLSIEKDGYRLCELIKSIQFVQSGESYIIDANGTDIAVSDPTHISWVHDRYNARQLLAQQEDPATRSVYELEQKGLNGQSGIGSYYWDGSLWHLAYAPVPQTGWVLLTSLREAELAQLTQSTLYHALTKGPALGLGILAFILLMALIISWIMTSMKKSEEINQRLVRIAHYDALTGAKNRNSYHDAIDAYSHEACRSLACVYIDANGLHELNNHLGHQAGDQMLIAVVSVLQQVFGSQDVYRIGGDEFVVFCSNIDASLVSQKAEQARAALHEQGYAISIGIEWRDKELNLKALTNMAEEAMLLDKQQYYQQNGQERQLRALDQQLEQMMLEKQDADAFLAVLAPEFKGVYFVDMGADTIRHLYIPPYFAEILREASDSFSRALSLYAQRLVQSAYRQRFQAFCRYDHIQKQLNRDAPLEFLYQKTDDTWLRLRVLKFKTYSALNQETLWIFSSIDPQEGSAD